MLDHYRRVRDHVELHGWDALRRLALAAVGFTALAVAVSGVWEPMFLASAFVALVLWFVSLGLLAFNLEERVAPSRDDAGPP